MNGRAQKYRYLPLLALVVVVMLAGGGVFWMVRSFLNSAPAPTKKVVQEIHVIRPPPPPPEAPPPPPPPPEEKDVVHEPEQKPDPTPANDPPPGEQLGLDATGVAGGDAFGLVGNKGGRDLLASGGSALAWYKGLIQGELVNRLQEEKDLRNGSYSASVQLLLDDDGSIKSVHLGKSTGDRERDKAIEVVLSRMVGFRFSQPPPPGTPHTVSVRFISHA